MSEKGSKREHLSQRLLGLISDPAFIKFNNIQAEPNIFKIVGRTHYERWHSAFWGWLLDSQGSHLLGDYVLTRLLYLLFDPRCLRGNNHNSQLLLSSLPTFTILDIDVTPNENVPTETSIRDVGRFDIFLTANYQTKAGEGGKLNILFELKIDSPTNASQSLKYADWINQNHPNDLNLLIYLVPKLLSDSKTTVGDDRWFCLDYQLLNDKLLLPVLDHPNLNDKVKPFIIQYIKNLSFRYRGIKMAITNEEKRLAADLYEKYSDVFDSIYDALKSEGIIEYTTSETPKGRASGKLAVKVNGQIFIRGTLRELLRDILIYLVDNNFVARLPMPWGNTPKRFVITNENPPVHPNGKPFFYPEPYQGYTLETHYARDRGLKVLAELCQKLDLEFEVVEV
ncbi:MAG: PD-(D/E)XK nuclease family protein [Acidobacteria bacterium]|nr:PD-(D/E)XK nuclease family protein [Acidobacteriota bacterium]